MNLRRQCGLLFGAHIGAFSLAKGVGALALGNQARAASRGFGHGRLADPGGTGAGVRACGLRALVPGRVLGPAPRDPGIPGAEGAALHGGEHTEGGAAHAPAQGGPGSRGPGAGMARTGSGTGAGPGERSSQAAPAPRPADRRALKGSFEVGAAQSGLPDYRHQRAGAQLPVVGHRDGGGPALVHSLHHDVAAAPSHLGEVVGFEDAADLASRKNALPSQRPPRRG